VCVPAWGARSYTRACFDTSGSSHKARENLTAAASPTCIIHVYVVFVAPRPLLSHRRRVAPLCVVCVCCRHAVCLCVSLCVLCAYAECLGSRHRFERVRFFVLLSLAQQCRPSRRWSGGARVTAGVTFQTASNVRSSTSMDTCTLCPQWSKSSSTVVPPKRYA